VCTGATLGAPTKRRTDMAATAESPLWRRNPEDLALWYETFEKLAATSPTNGKYFHGPHVGSPADLSRVTEGLKWLEEKHADDLTATPLPTVEQMLAAMAGLSEATTTGTRGRGSPCHNLWHWIHGD